MIEEHICVSNGNAKMGAVPSVSLPPIVTCDSDACLHCGKKCYAMRIARRRKTVKESYDRNLRILVSDNEKYWREVEGAIKMTTHFRFHVAGDIYDMDYLKQMVRVAERNRHCQILCFTKKFSLVNEYVRDIGVIPANLRLVFSGWKGLRMDNPYGLPEAHVMYRDGTTTASDGAKYCSGNCFECAKSDMNCWSIACGEQIIFREH